MFCKIILFLVPVQTFYFQDFPCQVPIVSFYFTLLFSIISQYFWVTRKFSFVLFFFNEKGR